MSINKLFNPPYAYVEEEASPEEMAHRNYFQSGQLGEVEVKNFYSNQTPFRQANFLAPYAGTPDPLAMWKAGNSVAGKNIVLWGDSTTQNALSIYDMWNGQLAMPAGPFAGSTIVNLGNSGYALSQALAGSIWTALLASNPSLIVACWGINDVRLGATTLPQLQALLVQMITQIKASFPGVSLLLWTPNSMMHNDPGATGYVVPLASAQAYTDIMWNAYNNVKGLYSSSVAFVDKQTTTFGRTCIDNAPLMSDILHPTQDGYLSSLGPLLTAIPIPVTPINLVASAAAWTANPAAPWTVYARALEDTRYCTKICPFIIQYFDLDPQVMIYMTPPFNGSPTIDVAGFVPGNIIWTPNGVYTIEGGVGTNQDSPSSCRMYSITKTSFPSNVPPLEQAVLYHKLP